MTSHTVQRIGALLVAVALLGSLMVASTAAPATAAKPRCDGKVATIVSSKKIIRGTNRADVIVAKGAKNNTIYGKGGADRICAGAGRDRIIGGSGADILQGGKGPDTLSGGAGGDTLYGGPGQDTCAGGAGIDWLFSCNEPSTSGLLRVTANTTLTAPHKGHIVIDADDVRLDCAGHVVTGPGSGFGIEVIERRGVTITNCRIEHFEDGIHLAGSHGNTLSRNRVSRNSGTGIVLHSSNQNRIVSNVSDESSWGFQLEASDDNVVEDNRARRNTWENFAVKHGSLRNTLSRNISAGADKGFSSTDDDSVFADNVAKGAAWAGFAMYGAGNTLRRNTAKSNGVGFHDASDGGSGTKGTDNTYVNNQCVGNGTASDPRGLCR